MKKVFSLFILSVFVCITLAACAPTHKSYDYEYSSAYISYDLSPIEGVSTMSETYSSEYADYNFVGKFSAETKGNFIETAENVLSVVKPENKLTYIVSDEFNTAYVEDSGVVFFNVNNSYPIDFLITLNQITYGAETNYGLLYAISYGQCKEYAFETPSIMSESKIVEVLNNNKDLLDMNVFAFKSVFTEKREQSAIRSFAAGIYKTYGLENLAQIAEIKDAQAQQNALAAVIKYQSYSIGVSPIKVDGINNIGGFTPIENAKYFIADSEKAAIYIKKDFVVEYAEEFYFSTYSDLKEVLADTYSSFAEVREFFNVRYDECGKFNYILDENYTSTVNNWEIETTARLCSIIDINHEYAHFLSPIHGYRYAVNDWAVEAIAWYCNTFGNAYYVQVSINAWFNYANENMDIVRELWKAHPTDNPLEIWDMMGYVVESLAPNAWITWVSGKTVLCMEVGGSLVNYLIKTYGKDKVLDLINTEKDEYGIFGKSFQELRDDWFDSLKEKFGELNLSN